MSNGNPTIKLRGILTDVFPIDTTPRVTKRVFWFKQPDTERYPQWWAAELIGEEVKRIMSVKIGDRIEVECEVRGRQYNRRDHSKDIFIVLKCVGIELLEKLPDRGTGFVAKPGSHDTQVDGKPQGELDLPL